MRTGLFIEMASSTALLAEAAIRSITTKLRSTSASYCPSSDVRARGTRSRLREASRRVHRPPLQRRTFAAAARQCRVRRQAATPCAAGYVPCRSWRRAGTVIRAG
eukprot:1269846-Pleurochrysis_carterae.AAC.1